MPIRYLILDAGGVMVHPAHFMDWNVPADYKKILGKYADDIPGPAWTRAVRAECEIIREDVVVGGMDAEFARKKEFFAKVASRMGWQLSQSQITALAWDLTWNPARYVRYDDVLPALEMIRKKYTIGVLSDAMPSFRYIAEAWAEAEFFDTLTLSTEVGACKPDTKMYQTVCCALGAEPDQCLFIDDRECNLRGAIGYGMHAAQMLRDGGAGWDGAIVRDFEGIMKLLDTGD